MRGRIRQLKPEIFLDDEFWGVIQQWPELPLLQGFLGLWCQADREGRFEWRPAMLKTQVLPYWEGDFALVLDALCEAGLLLWCEVDGRRYGAIRSFLKHQRPNNREPLSCIPDPLEHAQATSVSVHEPRGEAAEAPRASRPPLPTPTPDSRLPNPTRSSGIRVLPPVPGLALVPSEAEQPQHPPPSRREQRLEAEAARLGNTPPVLHEMPANWWADEEDHLYGVSIGLTAEEILERAEHASKKFYPSGFADPRKQFHRDLLHYRKDRDAQRGREMSRTARDNFEHPGRDRRRGDPA